MSKERQRIEELEHLVKQLKKAQEESASAIAMDDRKSKSFPSFRIKAWKVKALILAIIIIAVIVGTVLLSGSTFKKDTATFVEQVQEMATLATAEAHVKIIIEKEDNKLFGKDISVNFPGTKQELLLIVPATVVAGVDLNRLSDSDILVNEKEKQVSISLPRANFIQEPAIQMDQVVTYSHQGLFRGDVNWEEGFNLAAEAQAEIKKEAIAVGVLQTAENHAEKVITDFFGHLGYEVKVSYK
ncbi:DUF4230 domain-containing protein [Bacillus salitolerans]|uniref:DUF4230 domain-containing protein n=1 Tax=Bacillus salitolerans TaxID=1437434 RepID=A0ABW4LY10_9BACI